ncbi:MAG: outer membrane lipoprotein carrier protein LolA [Akkermansiaceae bacterium]|jgi:outer membrane lipoprotein-sorting protein|tara:strand:- start:9850 stop:10506 length:657 start_codon:yes stop_codon:yes gene_type:complete
MKFPLLPLLLMAVYLLMPNMVSAAVDKVPLEKWLKSQKDYSSVYAEFVQTRKLATLRKPLVNKGKMWAKRPDMFLWKMGNPAAVTVLRKNDNYLYLDKEKNEAVQMGADSRYARQFELMTGDMGVDLADFEKRFSIKETKVVNGVYHATFAPVKRQFRKRVPWLILSVDVKTNRTAGFEIHLEDKTVISTQFTKYSLNVAIPDTQFKADTTGYKVKKK